MKRLCILLIVSLYIATLAAQGQPIKSTAKISCDSILLGDPVQYTAVLELPVGQQAYFPIIPDSMGYAVELLGPPKIDTLSTAESTTYTLSFTFTSFSNIGVAAVPPITYGYGPVGQLSDSGQFPVQVLIVALMPHDTTVVGDIYDIKPPMGEPLTLAEVAPWVGVGLLLIALIVLAVLYIRDRRQNRPFLKIFSPPEPPHVVALRAIDQMRGQKLWASEEHKHYYTQLTDVLRIYLEGRFGIEAQEKTTPEILNALRSAGYDFGPHLEPLYDLLSTADLVKFAKHIPLIDENMRYLELSEGFVRSTMPIEAAQPTNTDNPQ